MAGDVPNLDGMLVTHALRAVGEGLSANQWLTALRESGAGIQRQAGLRIYGVARALAAEYRDEPTRPLDATPSFSESRQWPTRDSSGVLQTVKLVYRERVTNRIVQRFYNVKTPNGITRSEAISRAIAANADNAGQYEQTLIGAVHTGTAVLVPEAAA